MNLILLFFAGLFGANSIPHFVHGISGKAFHNPFLHRFVPSVPSSLFNVLWGLVSAYLAIYLFLLSDEPRSPLSLPFLLGFTVSSVGLSLLFAHRSRSNRPIA